MTRGSLSIREPDFAAEATTGEQPELHLTGNADIGSSSSFGDLLARLHEVLVEERARVIVVDMQSLEFMSASSFNAIVSWLQQVQELPIEQRYAFRFRPNSEVHWQRRSLRTLSCFATDLITIES